MDIKINNQQKITYTARMEISPSTVKNLNLDPQYVKDLSEEFSKITKKYDGVLFVNSKFSRKMLNYPRTGPGSFDGMYINPEETPEVVISRTRPNQTTGYFLPEVPFNNFKNIIINNPIKTAAQKCKAMYKYLFEECIYWNRRFNDSDCTYKSPQAVLKIVEKNPELESLYYRYNKLRDK